jgi:type II secretory pathway pseudopilin PulG
VAQLLPPILPRSSGSGQVEQQQQQQQYIQQQQQQQQQQAPPRRVSAGAQGPHTWPTPADARVTAGFSAPFNDAVQGPLSGYADPLAAASPAATAAPRKLQERVADAFEGMSLEAVLQSSSKPKKVCVAIEKRKMRRGEEAEEEGGGGKQPQGPAQLRHQPSGAVREQQQLLLRERQSGAGRSHGGGAPEAGDELA